MPLYLSWFSQPCLNSTTSLVLQSGSTGLAVRAARLTLTGLFCAAVKGFQRPVWRAREGIGTWMNVLDLIGFLGVITNAAMISFVGRQRSRILYVPEEASSFLLDRIQISALWFNFLVVEHSVLCLRVVVLALIPDVPEW